MRGSCKVIRSALSEGWTRGSAGGWSPWLKAPRPDSLAPVEGLKMVDFIVRSHFKLKDEGFYAPSFCALRRSSLLLALLLVTAPRSQGLRKLLLSLKKAEVATLNDGIDA
ncbi:hypothetical protein L207DRAFT_262211 [Hyaloscypha variabilis F]|uniref:Uncharacterized protein n=1 Tax=Hyaloscypha variabilis (strain UAMH 11265 / GT02V1 / F) TaxID=1149755 RepID=A0A2J6QSA3_HYAVF|nr:hypothetical protein L207DRAFT_262211 [Hyaloscypha variabilis F]